MRALRSLRVRLIAVFATVVVTAMGVLFLYVVPSLRADLISDRLSRLEAVARLQQRNPTLVAQFRHRHYARQTLFRVASLANARVSVYRRDGSRLVAVSVPDPPLLEPTSPLVQSALRSPVPVGGRTSDGGVGVAFRMPGAVVVMVQRVSDVTDAASLVERQFLIATGIALGVAALVGWMLAVAISQRLGRLELAADRVSRGEFDVPIDDQAPDELGQLARAFDLMQSRLAQVDRVRKDFIANASHELRTPLFSLAGFIELMENEDLDDVTREEFLITMREQVTRLTKLATDLLDLSRLDTGAVEIEQDAIDLDATARTLVREFRGLAAKHGSRVVLARGSAPTPLGMGDEQRVQQIGRALVDNAVRHTPRGTQVRVSVSADNGFVRLSVADDGPGIPADAHAHLFDRFYRGEDAAPAGSGLGLAIARELAQRMDGSLELDSEPGRTAFSLVLPAAGEPTDEA